MSNVLIGMVLFTNHPDLLEALQHNIHRIYKEIDRQLDKRGDPKVCLIWN